jgi:hypothetical protein
MNTLIVAHNWSQVAMWLTLLVSLPFLPFETAYDSSSWRLLLEIAQTSQVIDVAFSLTGVLRNNTVQTLMRYLIMIFIVDIVFPLAGPSTSLSLVVIALCLTEVPRYLFYTGSCKNWVGIFRYNSFIFIMPIN